ncbi:glucans biosynthesis glucosyltransferase MdoH, partial [Asaia sp. SF2.1]
MTDYTAFLIDGGIHPDDAAVIGPTITSYTDLQRWLDSYYPDELHPTPERMPIGAPFVETRWKRNMRAMFIRLKASGEPVGEAPDWIRVAERRRLRAKLATILTTILMVWLTASTMQFQVDQHTPFGLTLYWVWSILNALMIYLMVTSFYKLVIGSYYAAKGPEGNPYHPIHDACDPSPGARVAIIYPVYHEDAAAVAARLSAAWTTLAEHAPEHAHLYDLFLVSDSRKIEYWIAEQAAVYSLRTMHPDARVYYRWRPSNHHAKLGNIVDFCRRWSNRYRYMWMMDADSLMDGKAIHTTLRMMEGNHRLGILQTNPKPILRTSLFGRMQQFTSHICGTAFSHAMTAMHMGHASYIGHNAMIRMEPFVNHCMLPSLAGTAPWGGKPLSHDILEAAMMARAGYEVWFLPEIEGSYEEIPSNLGSFLQRERRWMQGNLQHMRFLLMDGITGLHREIFFTGVMGYLTCPIWCAFLLIALHNSTSFLQSGHIAPQFITTIEAPALMLLGATIVFLFLPRLIAVGTHMRQKEAKRYAGQDKIILSTLFEVIFFFFISPVIMVCLTRFFWMWLRRITISWGTQQRDDSAVPWRDVWAQFGWVSMLGVALAAYVAYQISQIPEQQVAMLDMLSNHRLTPTSILFWFMPLILGLTLSPALVRFSSETFNSLRHVGLFCTPEEIEEPRVITLMKNALVYLRAYTPDPENREATLQYAVS